jgi:hypothetical protein
VAVGALTSNGSGDKSGSSASNLVVSAASDYNFSTPSITAVAGTINARALTVSGQSISGTLTKTYDGNTSTAATLSGGVVSGGLSGDVISLSGQTLAYNSAHVVGANSISSSGTGALSVSGGHGHQRGQRLQLHAFERGHGQHRREHHRQGRHPHRASTD